MKISTKLEKLMAKATSAQLELQRNRYKNGSYSGSAGLCAEIAFDLITRELRELMKEAIKAEAVAEAKEQILAQITVKIQ